VPPHDRKSAMTLIEEASKNGARKYKACELLGVTLRTVQRWQDTGEMDQRKGAGRVVGNKLTSKERELILSTVNSHEYCDLPPCQIVPRLADKGVYIASESTIYRILREEKQLAHRGLSKPAKHKKPEQRKACGANQLWSWDITYLPSRVRGIYYYLYMIMDVYSRKIVGWSIHHEQSADHAAHLIKQSCFDEGIERNQVTLHSDNGTPMKGSTMLAMLETLGVTPSFSRPSVSDDNPFSEALFKTLKYRPNFPITDKFGTIFDARSWVIKFSAWYNDAHMHSGLKFITPNQRHVGNDKVIMKNRHNVYIKAKEKHPERWAKSTRNWQLPPVVTLNANRKKKNSTTDKEELMAAI
jgi:putative transposase